MTTPCAWAIAFMPLVFATPTHAEPLGRLFFTPEQRAELDRQRQEGNTESVLSKTLRVDGRVMRNGAVRTSWLNGRPHHRTESHQSETDATAGLRVGETLDLATRETRDLVPENAIHAERFRTR